MRTRARSLTPIFLIAIALVGLVSLAGCLTLPAWREPFPARAPDPSQPWSPGPSLSLTGGEKEASPSAEPKPKLPPAGKELTLAELVELALHNNPATRQAWAQALASTAELGLARAAWYPEVSFAYDLNYQQRGQQLGADSFDETNWGPTLKLTYLLLEMGGREAAEDEARQKLIAANLQYNQALQDLLLTVEEAYYLYLAAREETAAARELVTAAKLARRAAEEKHRLGLVAKNDPLQARVNETQAVYNLEQALGAERLAKVSLAMVAGLPAEYELRMAEPKDLPPRMLDEQADKLVEKAFKQRPDLLALKAAVSGRRAAVRATKAALWPRLGTELTLEHNAYDDRSGDWDYGAFLVLNYDIFKGFSRLYQEQAAQARLQAAQAGLAQAELNVRTQIWSYYVAYKNTWRQIEYARAMVAAAQDSHQAQLASYRQGLSNILDLVAAQSQLRQAKVQLVSAKTSLFLALARLAHACGSLEKPARRER